MSDITLRELNRLESKPLFSCKDPISALTHFIGFVASIILTPFLLSKAYRDSVGLPNLVGLSVYCLSMTALYGASAAYHTFILPPRPAKLLKKFDHISIYLLIAGTYTPICMGKMDRSIGIPMLFTVWGVAAAGIVMKIFWVNCPRFVSSIIYISMGWIAADRIRDIYGFLGFLPVLILLIGGILYTVGGVIYAMKFSISRDWSEHELFHLFILAGSLMHYLMIFFFVA